MMKFDMTKLDTKQGMEDFGDFAEMNKHFVEWRNIIFDK